MEEMNRVQTELRVKIKETTEKYNAKLENKLEQKNLFDV